MNRLAPICAVFLLSLPAGTAAAAEVKTGPGADGFTRVLYRAAPGEINRPVLNSTADGQSFEDFGVVLTAGPGCDAGPPIVCGFFPVDADLGDGDDVASINSFFGPASVSAGYGDDDILV